MAMYAMVEQDACLGCGSCEAVAPDVFRMNDEGLAEAYAEVTDDLKGAVEEAMEMCPGSCIKWDE